jgi:hypothetical protein
MLATACLSANDNDFALVAMLGLLGLRIFEACGASIEDLGEEHGHRTRRTPRTGLLSSWLAGPGSVAPSDSHGWFYGHVPGVGRSH